VLRNGAQHRSEFQRLFALMVQRWHAASMPRRRPGNLAGLHWPGGGLQRVLDSAGSGENIALFTSGGTIAALLHLIAQSRQRRHSP
jgi:broad specificity phosphatase PhoE